MCFSKSSNFDTFSVTHFLANRCQIELEVAWLLILIASSLYLHVKFLWPGLQLTFQFNVFVNTEYPNKIHREKQDKSQRTWPDHDDNHTQEVPAKSTEWQQATIVQDSGILVEDGRRQNSPDSTTEMNCANTKEREGDYETFYHKYLFHWFSLMRFPICCAPLGKESGQGFPEAIFKIIRISSMTLFQVLRVDFLTLVFPSLVFLGPMCAHHDRIWM